MAGTRKHRNHECVLARRSRHEGKSVSKSPAGGHAIPPLPGEGYSARVLGIALTTLPGGAFRIRPHFAYLPIQCPPNLVPAAYVAQDLLFNKRKCDVTAKTSIVFGFRRPLAHLRTSPLHDRSADQ